ncbi:terpene cyclase/mutase family protein [Clostridiaceae bacterium 35-E11]
MRKIIALILIFVMASTSFSWAVDYNATTNYLNKQSLDQWGILALYSAGESVKGKTLPKVDCSNATTDYEAYILGGIPLKRDVSNEVSKIIKAQRNDGKFADRIDGEGTDLVNAHIWGVISLYGVGEENYDKAKALHWLKAHQNKDGGFPVFTGMQDSDMDLTAMALIAYSILGLDEKAEEVKKAIQFIEKNLDKKESCETIAYYILARIKLGLTVDKKLYNKLIAYQLKDGSFRHWKKSSKGNYMATWHALLALVDYAYQSSIFTRLYERHEVKT